jgi:D-3-phosphoglycerate dehydrogenase
LLARALRRRRGRPTLRSPEIIGGYDAIVIRSATKLTADVIEPRRAPEGDRPRGRRRRQRRRRRGHTPRDRRRERADSTVVSAAEHTIGLLVALARNIPQAHAALKDGRWERARWGGIELADKTLGVLGFGRIGRQVARRALGLGMRVVGYDPSSPPSASVSSARSTRWSRRRSSPQPSS